VIDADIEACFDNIDHAVVAGPGAGEDFGQGRRRLVRAFLKAGVLTELGTVTQADVGTPQGGIISPLLANIACPRWTRRSWPVGPGGDQSTQSGRAKRRYHGLGNWRIVRYRGRLRHPHQRRQGRCATPARTSHGVLAGIGLRLSPTKTRIAHLSEGIDFLGFTLKWRKTRGGGKWHCATMISDKAFRTIKQIIRNLTPRRSPRPLADVIREVNAALRGLDVLLPARARWAQVLVPEVFHLEPVRVLATHVAPLELNPSPTMAPTPSGVGEPSTTTVSVGSTAMKVRRRAFANAPRGVGAIVGLGSSSNGATCVARTRTGSR